MPQKPSFAAALKTVRKARGLSQEAFSEVSSRTYLSSLERGLKSPTLNKIESLSEALGVHPLTLLALAYAADDKSLQKLLARVSAELDEMQAV
ncbi:MAG TPA: helix-turn-helix transcriptional regulator [Ramlibacter sp.]|uniref:helix-turn-helix domain-containing protein n=1 Tax=Ramlibacter sp. TaxID=1917967 RepID=UPI002BA60083|nr:helix-turn-helix transcriptional regulator [Ramlibacter sp.]HVZ43177.1 helix-turn-helix transcriptional regulator [Ramlibacter sp.]